MTAPVHRVSAHERRLQIEVLRLRAGYERLAVTRSACLLASQLRPAALTSGVSERLGALGLGWLGGSLHALRRYPLALSLLTSVVANPQRRRVALKTALIAALVWLGKRRHRSASSL